MKTSVWAKHLRALKPAFERAGITRCELRYTGCTGGMFLGFAHAKKRRNLRHEEEATVILACTPCHQTIEHRPEAEMERIVMDTIRRRRVQPNYPPTTTNQTSTHP